MRQADRIVLLAGGRGVEGGTHAELMARDGEYAELPVLRAEILQAQRAKIDVVTGATVASGRLRHQSSMG